MSIRFIIGEAGCGKTEVLIKIVKTLPINECIGIAYTHSAVNNIHYRYPQLECKTIHSYFRIELDSINIKPFTVPKKYIIIDEFSLIPVDMLINIFEYCKNSVIICAGDLLQLSPIIKSRKNVNIADFKKIYNLQINSTVGSLMYAFEHLSNTIWPTDYYQNSDKMLLTQNYRSNSSVLKLLHNVLENPDYIQTVSQVPIGFTVLSSKYELLQQCYRRKSHYDYDIPTKMGKCTFSKDDSVILTKNINADFTNGDIVKIIGVNENRIILKSSEKQLELEPNKNRFDILPINYLTIHKAQGQGLDNVAIILNDLFEITMLYTAITRARKEVVFLRLKYDKITKKDGIIVDTSNNDYIKTSVESFKLIKSIIYS